MLACTAPWDRCAAPPGLGPGKRGRTEHFGDRLFKYFLSRHPSAALSGVPCAETGWDQGAPSASGGLAHHSPHVLPAALRSAPLCAPHCPQPSCSTHLVPCSVSGQGLAASQAAAPLLPQLHARPVPAPQKKGREDCVVLPLGAYTQPQHAWPQTT